MAVSTKQIKEIKSRYEKRWLQIEGVVGVGIGATAGGNIGLIVSVKAIAPAIRKKIPDSVEGVPVDIQETGEIKALDDLES